MTIAELVARSHALSVEKGWYETWPDSGKPISSRINIPEKIALIHSEISEALEAYRSDGIRKRCPDCNGSGDCQFGTDEGCWKCRGDGFLEVYADKFERDAEKKEYRLAGKPEGLVVELADAVIRIADLCGAFGLDLAAAIEIKHAYNETRPHRHGGKLC